MSETIREVRIREDKQNLTQGLLEQSKLAQHAYEEGHKILSRFMGVTIDWVWIDE
jgi:hypothetical protein